MKKTIVGVCFALVAFASHAEYLLWQISNGDDGMADIGSWVESSGLTVDDVVARVVAEDGSRTRQGVSSDSIFLNEWYTAPKQSVDLSVFGDNYKEYSYYVEIVNASTPSQVLGRNTVATTYTSLANDGSIVSSLSDIPAVKAVWHGGSGGYKATPEPTSAMLMLLGVAGLALRRKQRKLA